MANSTMYQFRIDEEEKAQTFAILNEMGIKPAQAIRLFFRQVRQTRAMPFPIECPLNHTPNEATAKALLLSDEEKDYKRFDSIEALFDDLNN